MQYKLDSSVKQFSDNQQIPSPYDRWEDKGKKKKVRRIYSRTSLMLTYTCLEGTAIQRRRPSSNKPWTVPFVPGRSFLRWMIGFSCASLFALNLLFLFFFFILSFFMTDDPLRSRAVLHWGLPGKVEKKTVVHGSA